MSILTLRSHLADGEYEVILKEKDVKEFKCSPKKNSTWETKQQINGDPGMIIIHILMFK
jgi:hypothetical protein